MEHDNAENYKNRNMGYAWKLISFLVSFITVGYCVNSADYNAENYISHHLKTSFYPYLIPWVPNSFRNYNTMLFLVALNSVPFVQHFEMNILNPFTVKPHEHLRYGNYNVLVLIMINCYYTYRQKTVTR